VKQLFVDVLVSVLLFSCGLLVAWNGYAAVKTLSFLGVTFRDASPLIGLGGVAVLAAVGVYFRRRIAGIVGAISLLVLALLLIPTSFDETLVLALWDPAYLQFPSYIAPVVLVIVSVLIAWRFVLTPRPKTRTI
jgi:hypothetical protein